MNVHVSDDVYILGVGPGRVVRLVPDSGGFVVSVPGRGEIVFNSNGTQGAGSVRKVFFQNPVVVVPPANGAVWALYVDMTTRLFNLLMELDGK
jgi:hypothetical protein